MVGKTKLAKERKELHEHSIVNVSACGLGVDFFPSPVSIFPKFNDKNMVVFSSKICILNIHKKYHFIFKSI